MIKNDLLLLAMINIPETELWNQVDFADQSPDPGGGMLYAIRYDTETLYSHRENVVKILSENGVRIYLTEEGCLTIDLSEIDEVDQYGFDILVEELSVVNEAIGYHENNLKPDSIVDLSKSLKNTFMAGITSDDSDVKINALNLVDLGIPQLVDELEKANDQNQVLSKSEQRTISELGKFASHNSDLFGSHRVMVLGTYSYN